LGSNSTLQFPDNFLWGAATSSFQIEGATNADGRGESIWDRFCQRDGAIADKSDGRIACDHYHRYADDIALMSDLGLQAYRFSIAWPRIIPDGRGAINQKGLDFYDRLVDELLSKSIAPYATLYHWDLPQALEDENGWVNRDTANAFVDYTAAVVGRLGDRVASWATFNEPYCSAVLGYLDGVHAPGRKSLNDCLAATHHLLLAHGMAIPVIRDLAPNADAGIVLNFTPAVPATDSEEDNRQCALKDSFDNRWYIEPIAGQGYPQDVVADFKWPQTEVHDQDLKTIAAPIDFLGINYYTRQIVSADNTPAKQSLPLTDMGWEIYPQGIGDLLTRLHNDYAFKKYYITENGAAMPDVADAQDYVDDQDRIEYLDSHLQQLQTTVKNGVPLAGYFAWSLFDNFEWAYGYEKRFGLVRVNYETQQRTPKASAHWLSALIKDHQ